ncbi:MAG TPA: hypothetical protein VKV27_12645 [Solirubrobacteraceae bacterium]|nr:hypothetical protein [Solirubrobacteraceae bacterium]
MTVLVDGMKPGPDVSAASATPSDRRVNAVHMADAGCALLANVKRIVADCERAQYVI